MRALIGALVVGLLRSRPGPFSLVAILACLFVALSVVAPVNVAMAVPCETLIAAPLQDGVITSAVSVAGPSFTGPDGRTYQEVRPFCRVTATLTPTSDSLINVEVWMPISGWNLRFEGTGNGGYAGNIALDVPEMIAALNAGRAVAATDMGTAPSTNNDGDALVGHPEKWLDFGYRATHLMTVAAKQIVSTFYGQGPRYSYFHGCSTGGQQALMEAQRFPDDYDGILGGSPANNRTHVHTNAVWAYKQFHATPASYFTPDKVALVTKNVVAACALKSGGLASDNFLTDPRFCDWDPGTIQCPLLDGPDCLTADQIRAARAIYDGPRNPTNGHLIYPGSVRGSENAGDLGWNALGATPEPQFDSLFKWVFGATWLWQTYDFAGDMADVDLVLAPILNAMSTDLSAFKNRGGKLLMYHGWADPIIQPQDTINYYYRVAATQAKQPAKALKETQTFFRLFMVPGMNHCSSGAGPNAFGNRYSAHIVVPGPPVADAGHDAFLALQQWVEQGIAPERIVATKYVNDDASQGIQMTRPICSLPTVPTYSGGGDTNDAASFVCADDHATNNVSAAPEYLR
ncbi:MAG: tannase/feruloyl esterase family alpha/beta hydrolase [Candidatus Rokuibacteriota bacterium]|nr:MAG: tannase/feruloyl esterase family alpha/beta hydrolase [Candidatus Rokubacteria bacterium]